MRKADGICGLVLLALGVLVVYDARRYGIFGWGPAGPEAGLYPFLLGLGIIVGSLIILGNVVLMGRWSSLLLRGMDHALRVRVCAPMDVRVRRIEERLGVGPEEAGARIQRSDRGVRARIRQFFDVEWGDPFLYDLTLSTERVAVEGGADLVCHLLARPEWQPTEASRAALQDAALAARVRAALQAAPETARLNVKITCRCGRLELAGTVETAPSREAAGRIAAAQPGVFAVENHLTVIKFPKW